VFDERTRFDPPTPGRPTVCCIAKSCCFIQSIGDNFAQLIGYAHVFTTEQKTAARATALKPGEEQATRSTEILVIGAGPFFGLLSLRTQSTVESASRL
jgi:hypothetical protein